MLSQSATIGAALLADNAVKAIVSTRVYQEEPPARAVFPCLAYAESQSAAAAADNAICANGVTFDIDAFAAGSAWTLATAIAACMDGLGYLCSRAQSAGMTADGTIHQVSMSFTNIKEV